MGLRHVALLTRNLRETERFYTEVLDLERAFDHDGMLFVRTPGRDDLLHFVTIGPLWGMDHTSIGVSGRAPHSLHEPS